MASQVYGRITDQVVSLLERGVVPWRKPWAGSEHCPMNLASGKRYRGVNPFLLAVSSWSKGYEAPYWLTYRQAQERGGHVRKGEKSTAVIFYKQWRIEDRDRTTGELTSKTIPVLRCYNVFNVEQTADVAYPKPDTAIIDFQPIDRCEHVVRSMPNPPRIEHGGHSAEYRPRFDTVRMPNPERFRSAEHYHSTLFHELTHSTGHADRLNRPGIVKPSGFGSPAYAREELVAEMGAAFLCGHCGIETATIEDSAAYVNGWINRLRQDAKLVIVAASAAQRAADFILNQDAAVELPAAVAA